MKYLLYRESLLVSSLTSDLVGPFRGCHRHRHPILVAADDITHDITYIPDTDGRGATQEQDGAPAAVPECPRMRKGLFPHVFRPPLPPLHLDLPLRATLLKMTVFAALRVVELSFPHSLVSVPFW